MKNQQGFSAVELLITLFIGALFLMAGYQLYSFTFRASTEAHQAAVASNASYAYLRQYAAQAPDDCQAPPPGLPNGQSVTVEGLNNPRLTIVISCPHYEGVSLVRATITYDSPVGEKEVSHAVYTN